jgi:predicted aldo/keto reductase-like oxidoreductase
MEPVKGGTLADPPKAVKDLMKAANPDASYASWAIRFVATQPGILTVLSGMSTVDQMRDNISYMKNFEPLSPEEMEVIKKAQTILASVDQIPCTGCHYCTGGCPMHINIPDIFQAMNLKLIYDNEEQAKRKYGFQVGNGHGGAPDCIHCGQCEIQCPQKIHIRDWMDRIARELA